MDTILSTALKYLQAGFSFVPILPLVECKDKAKGKEPAVKWAEYQKRQPTEAEVRLWFNGQLRGIAIVGGAVSGNLEILDFDAPEHFEPWQEMVEEQCPGLISRLPRVQTPRPGIQVHYRCPIIEGNQKLSQRPDESGRPIDEIETRGEGGYALAPPTSAECHPAGRPYILCNGSLTDIPKITPEEREILLEAARSFNTYVPKSKIFTGTIVSSSTTGNGLRPGDDYNARRNVAELLTSHGWECVGRCHVGTRWKRPGGTRPSATLFDDSKLFYMFSTHAAPFLPDTYYPPFAVYALLENNGDFSAAARTLAAQGYGDQQSIKELRTKSKASPANSNGIVQPVRTESDDTPVTVAQWPAPVAEAAYYGLAGDIIRLIEPHTEADDAALLIQFLTAFGNKIGHQAHAIADGVRHYMNMNACLVGVTAKGRKGTSWEHVFRLFDSLEEDKDADWKAHIKSGLSSGEGLIWAVRDPIEKREPIKEKGRVVDYQTVIDDPGESDKRLLVVESEFASTLRVLQREGNTLSALIRQAWDKGDLRVLTKNSPAQATGAHISIIGHITADELRRYFDTTEAGNGFANRFLWLCVRRSKCLPDGGAIHTVDFVPTARQLRRAVGFARTVDEMKRDSQASELWRAVYPELSEGKPGLLGAVTSRAEAQVLRLSCIYALLDCSATIQRPHLEAALALWRYCEDSARFIFGDALGDPVADEILRKLRESIDGLTRTDISNLFGRNRGANEIGRALRTLVEAGLVYSQPEQSDGGRPAERWFAQHAPESKTNTHYEINEINEKSPVNEQIQQANGELNSLNSFISYPDADESEDKKGDVCPSCGQVHSEDADCLAKK